MDGDILAELGSAFLGSRLKRLAERMQADAARIAAEAGLPVQPAHLPLLAALDRHGPLTVGRAADVLGVSQPGVTRTSAALQRLRLIEMRHDGKDARRRTIALTLSGAALVARARALLWPRFEQAIDELCAPIEGPLLDQLAAIERALSQRPLYSRAAAFQPFAGLSIHPYAADLAPTFYAINAAWIEALFQLEPTDIDVMTHPYERIIAPGGDILFVEAEGMGIVGTCALQKTGTRQFELIKMGVLEAARGRRAGEFLLHATIARAMELGADRLYLLSNARNVAAVHLYEKLGFVHDSGIMAEFGARYDRCDVAMLYRPAAAGR